MNKKPANRSQPKRLDQAWTVQLAVFIAIVLIGIASRFWLVEMPNFKPVAALVLFGGFFFRRSWIAVVAIVSIMILSDLRLGVYDWKLAICVYASLGLAGVLGVWIKRSVDARAKKRLGVRQAGKFVIASLVMSVAFFLLTNAAVCLLGQWHPTSWAGLMESYAAGLPFFRSTLISDMFFTGVLVSSYAAVEALQARYLAAPVSEPAMLEG